MHRISCSDRLLETTKGKQCVSSGSFVYENGDAPDFLKTYHPSAPSEAGQMQVIKEVKNTAGRH